MRMHRVSRHETCKRQTSAALFPLAVAVFVLCCWQPAAAHGPYCSCPVAAPRHLALARSAFGNALVPWARVRAAGNTNTCAGQVRVRPGPAVLASCRWPQERHCAGLQVPTVAGLACGVGLGRGAAQFIGSRGRLSTGAVGHELATGHM